MDTTLFIMAKLAGALLRVDTWIILLAAFAWLLHLRRRPLPGVGFIAEAQRSGRRVGRLLGLLVVGLVTLAVLPLGQVALATLEKQYPRPAPLERLAGLVVLGGGEDVAATRAWGVASLGQGAERLTAAIELARRFPRAEIIYAGGSGRLRDTLGILGAEATEADVARAFFAAQGIAPERISFDSASRNTSENAVNAARAKGRGGAGGIETSGADLGGWVLVTSAFHMPRALASFRRVGWEDLTPYPVDYRTGKFRDGLGWDLMGNLLTLQTAIREYVGLVAYWALGR
jgi:uncharacterized SAM-binding protein YcdF (DUF218 family)